MGHTRDHIIIQKLQEFAAAHPYAMKFCKYLAAFVAGGLLF